MENNIKQLNDFRKQERQRLLDNIEKQKEIGQRCEDIVLYYIQFPDGSADVSKEDGHWIHVLDFDRKKLIDRGFRKK